MPPNKRKAPRRGAEGGASSDAAVEDEVDVGVREDWNNAAREATRGKKAAMRNDHLAMILALREGGKEMLKGGGLQQWSTEGIGDCWLISLLAGSGVFDAEQVQIFTKDQRKDHLTPWREKLVKVAADVDTKCFSMSGEPLGIEYLKHVASNFLVSNAVIEKHSLRSNSFTVAP